jgi:hypothetical protein
LCIFAFRINHIFAEHEFIAAILIVLKAADIAAADLLLLKVVQYY